jgi:PAS domain S-box-containing protein
MDTNKYKILVVDDDPDILLATVRILRSEGFEVLQAESGKEALEQVKQHPDLLLLDVVMDDMDGHEVCRRVKANPDYSEIFVVFTSGTKVTPSSQTEGLNLGADGYIVRPFTRSEFIARVKSFIRISAVQKKITASEKWLETTLNSLADSVIVTDDSGMITFMNPAAEKLSGWLLLDVINNPVDQILRLKAIENSIVLKDWVNKFLKEKQNLKVLKECLFFRKDGEVIYASVKISAIPPQRGVSSGAVIIIQDIDEQKKTQIELDKYRNHLEELVKERTAELEKKNQNLQHYHELFIQREYRIKELRDEIEELKEELEVYKN